MKKKHKLALFSLIIICILTLLWQFGLPVFAQSRIATLISGQPLSTIAAKQIIYNSGLPIETLPDGSTNEVTRGRDYVNAYRYAHSQLYTNGWYRGISEDHTPLIIAMINAIEEEGFISYEKTVQDRRTDILYKFWYASDEENAKELGFISIEDMNLTVENLPTQEEYDSYVSVFSEMWR